MAQTNLSGVEIGRRNAERLRDYISTLKAEGKPVPSRGGKPNFSAIALACGFDRQVFYNNPVCKELIDRAAADCGLQPTSTDPDSSRSEKALLEAKILRLEQQNAALKAEVEELRKRLRQLRHIEDHLVETGRRVTP